MLADTAGLGIRIGLPISIIFILIFLIGTLLFAFAAKREGGTDRGDFFLYMWMLFGGLVITLSISAWSFWPLKREYHWWSDRVGTVQEISSRLAPNGSSMEQKYVVTLEGDPHPYGVLDTRASLLKKGDRVSLSCIRVYEFGSGDDGYNCKWGARGK